MANILHLAFEGNATDLKEAEIRLRAATYGEVSDILEQSFLASEGDEMATAKTSLASLIEQLTIDGQVVDLRDVEHVAASSILMEILAFLASPRRISKPKPRPSKSGSQAKPKRTTTRKSDAS